jgi:hypothetical protein
VLNNRCIIGICGIFILLIACNGGNSQDNRWLSGSPERTVLGQIEPPSGYSRIEYDSTSYAGFLRRLPLKPAGSKIYLYNGRLKGRQDVHRAVIDIDIGNRNLQQCADAVIRMRSQYFYSRGMYDSIAFNFTSGDRASFRKWVEGYRPRVNGNDVTWVKNDEADSSYEAFREYLRSVFMYAGSYSLEKELIPVNDNCTIEPGYVFIEGGFPGHAVFVIDVCMDRESGKRLFLLAQGFMPAQDIHVLINPIDNDLSPWYDCEIDDSLITPEWTFERDDLMRFP